MTGEQWEQAERFFLNLNSSAKGQEELKRYDRDIEFEIPDGTSFTVHVQAGKVNVEKVISSPTSPSAIHFTCSKDLINDLFRGRKRYTDVYTAQKTGGGGAPEGKLLIKESPMVAAGGTGGPLVWWAGKLIRMAQELR